MKTGILYITDLHIKSNCVTFNMDKVYDAICAQLADQSSLFIALGGDIAFSGKKAEYDNARRALDSLISKIKFNYNNLVIKIIMTPGNHDNDFDLDNNARKNNISSIISSGYNAIGEDGSVVDSCTGIQKEYFNFAYSYNNEIDFKGTNRLYYRYIHEIGDYKILFNCYNTAWLSKQQEVYGELFFPVDRKKLDNATGFSIKIAIFHHPVYWMNPKNENPNHVEFMDEVIRDNSIALIGHEHTDKEYNIHSSEKNHNNCRMVYGEIFHKDDHYHGFKFISINDDLTLSLKTYLYDEAAQIYREKTEKEYDIKNSLKCETGFYIKNEYDTYLRDYGFVGLHPTNKKMDLVYMFVYPNLRNIGSEEMFTKSSDLIKKAFNGEIVILCGSDQIGKTSLLKKYHFDTYRLGYIPISIKGEDLANKNIDQMIKKCLKEQYENGANLYDEYTSLKREKKCLLIDNLHLIKKEIDLPDFIKKVRGYVGFIITTTGMADRMDNFSGRLIGVDDVHAFDIMRFGNVERESLIKKWMSYYNDEAQGHALNQQIEFHDRINDVIGKNMVPSYPLFLITILNSLVDGNSSKAEVTSYGYCYQALIYLLLRYNGVNEKEIDSYFNFLTHMSYYMYRTGNTEMSQERCIDFFKEYEKDYVFKPGIDIALGLLVESGIMQRDHFGSISYKYPYIYYYFVSKCISDFALADNELITKLCANIQEKENSFILLFLTHHTKDDKVIEEILLNTMCTMDEYKPIQFSREETGFMDHVIGSVTELVLEEIEPEAYRNNILRKKDAYEQDELSSKKDIKINSTETKPCEDHAFLIKKAIVSININGMIIRNRYGSIKKDRLGEIIEAVYLLNFRMISFVMKYMLDDTVISGIVENVKELLRDSGSLSNEKMPSKEQIRDGAQKVISSLLYMINYHIMEATSYSIGNENLIKMYENTASNNGGDPAYLLTFMIKNKVNRFDVSEMKKLANRFKDNKFLLSALQKSVLEYLYMHDLPYKEKCSIADIMHISVKKQLVLKGKLENN